MNELKEDLIEFIIEEKHSGLEELISVLKATPSELEVIAIKNGFHPSEYDNKDEVIQRRLIIGNK